jgi:dihydroorotate dehydrogenase
MKKFIISAPFGNWLESKHATSTLGTYTVQNRAGLLRWRLWWKMLSTIRYCRGVRGWTNKLGLPNPGIKHLEKMVKKGFNVKDKIISIHGFNNEDWIILLSKIKELQPLAVELNVSCPNVGEIPIHRDIFLAARYTGVKVIVKLPPVNYESIEDAALQAGIEIFHCCNTYPIEGVGGLSGTPLKPLVKDCIIQMMNYDVELIAGGGIRNAKDVKEYKDLGADKFAVASMLFHPKYWFGKTLDKTFETFEKELN